MSDFEYEDDLDILTSLLDEEDDDVEAKVRKSNASSSSLPNNGPYKKKPQSERATDLTASRKADGPVCKNSERTLSTEASGSLEGQGKEETVPGFDEEEDMDDLTALLEAEKADGSWPEPDQAKIDQPSTSNCNQTTTVSSASQSVSKRSLSPGLHSPNIKSEDDDDRKKTSPEKSDEDMSKEELLAELQRMKTAMEEMKAKQSSPENQTAAKKSSSKSSPKEMFSDAIAPKLEKVKKAIRPSSNKNSKVTPSQQSGKGTGSRTNKDGNSSSDDGNRREKKKYTMDAAAATKLFHSSQNDDHQDVDSSSSSSESEEEENYNQKMNQSSTPAASTHADLFTKNKRRVAHTPNNRPNKPKKESPYQCKLCDKTFDDFNTFQTHQFNHRKNPANTCSLCHKTFASRSQLETHLRSHGESGQRELQKLSRPHTSSKPRSQTPSSGYKSGYSSAGCSSSSQGGASGSRLFGDQRKKNVKKEEPFEVEQYSQLRIINPVVSSAGMKEKMTGRKFIRLSIIKKYITTGGDVEGDWATMGVIISKVPPKTSSKGKVFSIWKLNDLTGLESTVALFLFGKVHEQHWKSVEGSVVGILNANIMPNRDHGQPDEIAMTVDHPQKMLIMGKSKDFGFCKAKKKNGNPCTMVVNKENCEYCEFHVQHEYKKVSAKRADLQATYSGTEPKKFATQRLNNALKGTFFHGGKSFTVGDRVKLNPTTQKKGPKAVCKSLGSGKAVDRMMEEVRKDVVLMHGKGKNEEDTLVSISGASNQFKDLLSKPTPGSQNLMRHMVTAETKEMSKMELISASDLIKQQKQQMKAKKEVSKTKAPKLGRGIDDDEDFLFFTEIPRPQEALAGRPSKSTMSAELAKKKALQMIKKTGPLTKKDPNCIGRNKGSSERKQEAVRRRAERDWHGRNGNKSSPENCEEPAKKRKKRGSFFGSDDSMSKEQMTAIINAKSKNAGLLAEVEAEWQDKYFTELEKKEKLEIKMSSVMQRKCKVVSCKKCNYTWFAPSTLCKTEHHVLKWHEAEERFYLCQDCKTRTITFDKIPTRPCRSCGSTNFDRTSMLKERKGPKLESEKLLIRGEERKSVHSL